MRKTCLRNGACEIHLCYPLLLFTSRDKILSLPNYVLICVMRHWFRFTCIYLYFQRCHFAFWKLMLPLISYIAFPVAHHLISYYIIPIRLICKMTIRRCFSVSLYPYKVFFVYLPFNFCFRSLKYFSKSNAVTNSPDWFASTLNTWLLGSPYLQNHLASSDRRYLNKNMWCPQSDFNTLLTLFV